MRNRRTIVIGDIHGCLEELDELLQLVDFRNGQDLLGFVGDLVDRGPDSAGVVRRAMELTDFCVLGNHDEKYTRFDKHEKRRQHDGTKNPMKMGEAKEAIYQSLGEKELDFIRTLPLYYRICDNLVAVHAGFEPETPVAKQAPNACMRLRYIDNSTRKFVASAPGIKPANSTEWSRAWMGPESVVFGHIVHDLYHPRIDEPRPGVFCYGIDTGCCFGGMLTAMVFEGEDHKKHEFFRVRAKRKYAKWLGGDE